jgi:integrase
MTNTTPKRALYMRDYFDALMIAEYTGFALQDILSLTWDDVDLDKTQIKNPTSLKRVEICREAARILEHRKQFETTPFPCRHCGVPFYPAER